MSLLGKRDFKVHYGGCWNKIGGKTIKIYIGRKIGILKDIVGDELCFMDLVKDIEEKCGFPLGKELNIVCLLDNSPIIDSDFAMMMIWDVLVSYKDNFYHLFVCPSRPLDIQIKCKGEKKVSPPLKKPLESNEIKGKKTINTPVRKSLRLMNNAWNNSPRKVLIHMNLTNESDEGDTNEPEIKVQTLPNDVTNDGYYSEVSDASDSGDYY